MIAREGPGCVGHGDREGGYPPLVRRSAVRLPGTPARVEPRGGWNVVLAYEDEGEGPWLVDLSHRVRWDIQDARLDDRRPFGLEVPGDFGGVRRGKGLLLSRMNRTQASISHVGPEHAPSPPPDDIAFTETTDAHAWLAVLGEATPDVMERVTSLDLFPPGGAELALVQGPVLHVPCQVVTLGRDGVLLALARGYGRTFADALLASAADVGLRPAGVGRFANALSARDAARTDA